MNQQKTILYGGYGANRDAAMLWAITGNTTLQGKPAVFRDVELCIQHLNQISDSIAPHAPAPVSPKSSIVAHWGNNFETYTIRPKKGSTVSGCVFELTELERALIAEWEMIEFGWYTRMQLTATLENGQELLVNTEGLAPNQEADSAPDGIDYPTYLNDKEAMIKTAKKVRLQYLSQLN